MNDNWIDKNLVVARQVVRNSGFHPRTWKDCGDGISMGSVWAVGRVGKWSPRIWIIPQFAGRSLLVPGFTKGGTWLWNTPVVLRGNQDGGLRTELASKLKTMRNYLWLWSQLSVPAGAGEKIGPAVEKRLAPWYKGELPHHGRIWQGREPMEYRGISLLEAFDEIVEEEWARRLRNRVTKVQAAKALTRFYLWYKIEWPIPSYLALAARKETQKLWLHEKKVKLKKLKGRKRSLISDETIAKLKAERREMKDARRRETVC